MLRSITGSLRVSSTIGFTIILAMGPVSGMTDIPHPGRMCTVVPHSVARHHGQTTVKRRRAPAPVLRKVTPNTMQVSVPSTIQGKEPEFLDLVVTGTGFKHGSALLWDGKPLTSNFVDTTRLTARVPFKYLSINVMRTVKPNDPPGSGPRGMSAAGATGTAGLRVRNPGGRTSNRIAFTVAYEVVGG